MTVQKIEMMKLDGNAEELMDWLGDAVVGWDLDAYGPVYFGDGWVVTNGGWVIKGLDGKFRASPDREFDEVVGAL